MCTCAERSKIYTLLQNLTSAKPEDQRFAAGEIRLLAKGNTHNRVAIAEAGAIQLLAVPGIRYMLKKGSMIAKENAAATLFSLSVVDENKVTIGGFGAIPPLVALLNEGHSLQAEAETFSGAHQQEREVIAAQWNLPSAVPSYNSILGMGMPVNYSAETDLLNHANLQPS
ncbi:hypothetical protein AgCh_000909 [Apium graveolens]